MYFSLTKTKIRANGKRMNPLTERELHVETETGIETEYNFPKRIKNTSQN